LLTVADVFNNVTKSAPAVSSNVTVPVAVVTVLPAPARPSFNVKVMFATEEPLFAIEATSDADAIEATEPATKDWDAVADVKPVAVAVNVTVSATAFLTVNVATPFTAATVAVVICAEPVVASVTEVVSFVRRLPFASSTDTLIV